MIKKATSVVTSTSLAAASCLFALTLAPNESAAADGKMFHGSSCHETSNYSSARHYLGGYYSSGGSSYVTCPLIRDSIGKDLDYVRVHWDLANVSNGSTITTRVYSCGTFGESCFYQQANITRTETGGVGASDAYFQTFWNTDTLADDHSGGVYNGYAYAFAVWSSVPTNAELLGIYMVEDT